MEDTHYPAASFRILKMFLAHTASKVAKVFKVDEVSSFLQEKIRSRVFFKLNKIYGEVFPEFAEYCGITLLICKVVYNTASAGNYWYQDWSNWLLSVGFKECPTLLVIFSRK